MKESIFSIELEKLAKSKQRENAETIAKILALQGVTTAGGYGAGKYLYPYILKQMGKSPKPVTGKASAVLGFMAGLSMMGAHHARRRYVDGRKRNVNSDKNRNNKNVLSSNKQLAKRQQGHSSEVSKGVLRSDARRSVPVHSRSVPVRRGRGRGANRDNNYGSLDNRYKYGGKTPRYYRFQDSVPVQQSRDG